jgi:hypothetical protein
MTKEEIEEKYKQDRHINPLYSLDEDERYLINEIFLLHEELSKLHQPTVSDSVCKKCGTHTDRDSEGVWCEGCQTYTYD